jgi:acyl carrier protein
MPSTRTPEGVPNQCPVCRTLICIEPSQPLGDAPCPSCGTLLWFYDTSAGMRFHESQAVAPLRAKLFKIISERLGAEAEQITPTTSFLRDVGADSLDVVELVMEVEKEFGVTISDDEAENIKTVGDAIDYLAKRYLQ